MRGSDSIGRSPKKADGRIRAKLSGKDKSPKKSNGTPPKSAAKKKTTTSKSSSSKMGNGNSVARTPSPILDAPKSKKKKKSPRRKGNKQSQELRPRRRASQTYFFKYQLARNPLKAEEEDLKLALLASLQQCTGNSDVKSTEHCKNSSSSKNITIKSEPGTKSNNSDASHQHNGNGKTNGHSSNKHKGKNPSSEKKFKPSFLLTTNAATVPATTSVGKPSFDEEYLEKYKPETEDFLTFICFRNTAPNFQDKTNDLEAETSNVSDSICTTNGNNDSNTACKTNNRYIDMKHVSIDIHNLKRGASSPAKSNGSPTITDYYSPNIHRRPTRQSPRLASSQKKISENDNSTHNVGTTNTAYDNPINYEEDMKRASIALEDMAQEINSSDGMNKDVAQNSTNYISKLSSLPFKHNKHLVKGLMTREFAGAFADEETFLESISNHKL